jgi:hypothetical protein
MSLPPVPAMNVPQPSPPDLDPARAALLLANLGFLASSDLPDRPGPAYLLVAMRPRPTLRHYDPERIDYWTTVGGLGRRGVLTRAMGTTDTEFSWGLIRIVDRLGVSNEYLTFGGHLQVGAVGDATIAVFASPVPLLRRGGHSQGWDHGAPSVGAFFGRLLVAVDYVPGFETRLAHASPVARFAAFVGDLLGRYRASPDLRAGHPELAALIEAEERTLRREHAGAWAEGLALLEAMGRASAAGRA